MAENRLLNFIWTIRNDKKQQTVQCRVIVTLRYLYGRPNGQARKRVLVTVIFLSKTTLSSKFIFVPILDYLT